MIKLYKLHRLEYRKEGQRVLTETPSTPAGAQTESGFLYVSEAQRILYHLSRYDKDILIQVHGSTSRKVTENRVARARFPYSGQVLGAEGGKP